jgi:hypothetical protein
MNNVALILQHLLDFKNIQRQSLKILLHTSHCLLICRRTWKWVDHWSFLVYSRLSVLMKGERRMSNPSTRIIIILLLLLLLLLLLWLYSPLLALAAFSVP